MSDRIDSADGLDLLAAEYALGVLDADAYRAAEARTRSDPAFAADTLAWAERLSPLLDGVEDAAPSPEVWTRIEAQLDGARPTFGVADLAARRVEADARAARLERSRAGWRGTAMGAIAASVALLLVTVTLLFRPAPPRPIPPAPAPLMVAQMTSERGGTVWTAAYDPTRQAVLVSLPPGAAPAGRAAQLWLIDASGKPQALGLLNSGGVSRMVLPQALAQRMRAEVTLAVSIEPPGGSPTGQPTGPVVAKGALRAA